MKVSLPKEYAQWKGIPREEIKWHPTVNESKCTGCGMCFTSCGREVFDYDRERKKATVARPLQCLVGCTSCETWCVFQAISFPEKDYIRQVIKKHKILNLVKKQLEEKLHQTK